MHIVMRKRSCGEKGTYNYATHKEMQGALAETDETDEAGKDGGINLKTGYIGTATLQLAAPGFVSQTFTIEIKGDSDIDLGEATMQPQP